MKTLELNLQKRLLIVEGDMLEFKLNDKRWLNDKIKLICKGSELTEEIAKGLVVQIKENIHLSYYVRYKKGIGYYTNALESFISAINFNGCHWGINPITEPKQPPFINPKINGFSENDVVDYRYELHQFHESESKTFNPDKSLIFEIL